MAVYVCVLSFCSIYKFIELAIVRPTLSLSTAKPFTLACIDEYCSLRVISYYFLADTAQMLNPNK